MSKPSWIFLGWELFVLLFWITRLSNSLSYYPCRIIRIKEILTSTVLISTPSIDFLNLLRNYMNSSGFTLSKSVILNSYVSDPSNTGFCLILSLMTLRVHYLGCSCLATGIGGGSIRAYKSDEIQERFIWSFIIRKEFSW